MPKKSASSSSVVVALVAVGAGLFGLDYITNNADTTTNQQGSSLVIQLGDDASTPTDNRTPETTPEVENEPEDIEEPTTPSEPEGFSVTDPDAVDPLATTPSDFGSLVAKNLFTKEALVEAGFATATLQDVKTSSVLFDRFIIDELGENLLTKQALIVDNKLVAYVHSFPSEAYSRGLSYDSIVAVVQTNLPASYNFNSPSELSPVSFYLSPKDGNDRSSIFSVVEVDDTLLAVEYPSVNYTLFKEIFTKLTE